jgi:HEAT repeat protein
MLWVTSILFLAGNFGCDGTAKDLNSADPLRRVETLRRLQQRQDRAHEKRVLELLKDSSPRVRRAALAALGPIGGNENLSAVIDRLGDEDLGVRLGAVRLLAKTQSKGARAALLQLRLNSSGLFAVELGKALTALGMSPVEQREADADSLWARQFELLARGSEEVRIQAVEMLALNERKKSVAQLARYLKVDSVALHQALVAAIARIGGKAAVSLLETLSRSEKTRERLAVAKSAVSGRLGKPLLLGLLKDKDIGVRRAVLEAMPMAAKDDASLKSLICAQLLDDAMARQAAGAIGRLELACGEARTSWLNRFLKSDRSQHQLPVLLALKGDAIDPLLLRWAKAIEKAYAAERRSWLDDKAWVALDTRTKKPTGAKGKKGVGWILSRYPKVRGAGRNLPDSLLPPVQAVGVLRTMVAAMARRPQARRYLLHLALHGIPRILRTDAFKALGSFDIEGGSAVEAKAVLNALKGDDLAGRQRAMDACHLGGKAVPALLPEWLAESNPVIREGAARCAARLKRKGLSKQLEKLALSEQSPAAISALGQVGDTDSVAILARLVGDDENGRESRRLAAGSLGEVGLRMAGHVGIGALTFMLADRDPVLRLAAAEALRKLGPHSISKPALAICSVDFYAEIRRACVAALR